MQYVSFQSSCPYMCVCVCSVCKCAYVISLADWIRKRRHKKGTKQSNDTDAARTSPSPFPPTHTHTRIQALENEKDERDKKITAL